MDQDFRLVKQLDDLMYFCKCNLICQNYKMINQVDYMIWTNRTKTSLTPIPESDDRFPNSSERPTKQYVVVSKECKQVYG